MNKKILTVLFISLTLIMCSAVAAENLTTTEQGEVNGGVYTHAVQKTPYSNQRAGGNLEEVSFNITNKEESNINYQANSDENQQTYTQSIKDVDNARLYTMVYVQGTNNRYGAIVNVTLDGDNDGSYETVLENNRVLQLQSSTDGTVYTINENITRVYSDYLLSYDIAKYIKADTINVHVQTYSGTDMGMADAKIKCIGLLAAYNVTSSDEKYNYWFNTGHAWTNSGTSTTFPTENTPVPEQAILTQVSTSSSASDVFVNGVSLDAQTPSNYFSENVWDITDLYDESTDIVLENLPGEGLYGSSFKTISAALVLANTEEADVSNVKLDKIRVSSNGGDALVYVPNTIQVSLINEGSQVDNAKLTLKIGDYTETVDISNLNSTTQNFNFIYVTQEKNTYNTSVEIDYLNGSTETLYTGTLEVKYNGYMGKSFTGGENFTTKREYEGLNSLTIIPVHEYQSANWEKVSSTINTQDYGIVDNDKYVEMLYYQPYNWDYDYVLNTYQLSINNNKLYPIAQYNDTKGFGTQWDFPSGLLVYNITDYLIANSTNTFNITRIGPANLALYTGYIVAIYKNATQPSIIKITEETDLLNTEASGYGTNSTTAISYAIYNDINTTDLNSSKIYVVTGAANWPDSNIFINDVKYGSMSDNWNYTQQMSFSTYNVTNLVDDENIITLQSVEDNLVIFGTILTMTYNEEAINVTNVSVTSNSNNFIANANNNIRVTLKSEKEHSPVEVTLKIDDDELTQSVENVGTTTTVDFNYVPTTAGTKNVEVTIKYLNDTTETAYTGSLEAYLNGYMGKTYTNGNNLTIKREYEGNYNLYTALISNYQYASWSNASENFDASAAGLVDSDKVRDILFYLPYNWDANVAVNSIQLAVNDEIVNPIANYSDRKGFGGWDYPSGLIVYNITPIFKANAINSFKFTKLTNDQVALYGGYIVAIYENATSNNKILITEECDLLCAGSSGYGANSTTATSYAIYDNINTDEFERANLIVISASSDERNGSIISVNDKNYVSMNTNYDSSRQVALTNIEVDNLVNDTNIISMKSLNDNLVSYSTILLLKGEDTNSISINNIKTKTITDRDLSGDLLANQPNIISINITNDKKELNAQITVKIEDIEETFELTNFTGETILNITYEPTSIGEKTLNITIKYDDDSITENTTILNAYYNGYMGNSFNNGQNITTKHIYTGNNSLVIIPIEFYLSNNWQETEYTFNTADYGITEQSKIIDVLYYQGYNWLKNNENMTIVLNNEPMPESISQYNDTKGFGNYNYPSGLLVFQTNKNQFKANSENSIILLAEGNDRALYGGYFVVIYANNTEETDIIINEGSDILNPESSGYGANSTNTIAYANYENINAGDALLYTISAAADKTNGSKIIVNNKEYESLADNYNNISRISIVESNIDNIVNGTNLISLQSINDNLFAMSTILVVKHPTTPNVIVNNVDVPASKGDLLVETANTISINITNNQSAATATLNITIDNESTTRTLENFTGETTLEITYNPTTTGSKDIKVEIIYNDTTQTLYEGTINAYYNGYRGKSFTNGENFTTQRQYEGKNTLILEQFNYYNWKEDSKAIYDATQLDNDKIIDVLYYQGYNWDKYLNFTLKVNDEESPIIANYSDSKGFGTYNYPSGVVVFNITGQFKAGQINQITPIQLENNNNILYGGILIIIYANNTETTSILINEGADILNPESSGLTSNDYTIAYSNYENIKTGNASLYTISAAADKTNGSKIIVNNKEYQSLADNYDNTSKLSIIETNIDNLVNGTNLISLQSINDNLFAMGTILVVTHPSELTLKVDTTKFTIGSTANISASIYDGESIVTEINKGKVVFKVNGKTLKDANDKVIYVKIINGTATITDYEIPESWAKEGITIEAVYSGSTQYSSLRSQKEVMEITNADLTITTQNVAAKIGQTITLNATIDGGLTTINTGKVVFKINGKTLKDTDGKVIYLNVTNGQASLEFTIPDNYKAKEYSIQATYISTNYERIEDTKTLTVTK